MAVSADAPRGRHRNGGHHGARVELAGDSRRHTVSVRLANDVHILPARGNGMDPHAFRADVAAAAASLPGKCELLNLCEDRCSFLVLFAAALSMRRTVLLPPSRAPAAIAELRSLYPDSATVDDSFVASSCQPPFDLDPCEADFVAAIGHTSGSTGRPGAHAKSFRSLAATTALNAGVLRAELDRQGRIGRPWIVATVPPQHMYGLELSVLLPLLAGFGLHGGRPLLPADVAAALSDVRPPRVLVSTPVHLRALLESGTEFPDIAIVVSATAPLGVELARLVEQRLGAALIEMFGSTETCVIATRRTAMRECWLPYPGVCLEPAGSGTTVRAPWLPQAVLLHDILAPGPGGTFEVIGRQADVIEIAGKRASLADITRRIARLPGVKDAHVFRPAAQNGAGVPRCAALVVAPGLAAQAILALLRREIDEAFLPRPLVVVDELPRNEIGKLPVERAQALLARAIAASPRHPGK